MLAGKEIQAPAEINWLFVQVDAVMVGFKEDVTLPEIFNSLNGEQ